MLNVGIDDCVERVDVFFLGSVVEKVQALCQPLSVQCYNTRMESGVLSICGMGLEGRDVSS